METKDLNGFLRGLAWGRQGRYLIVVGNKGSVLKIQDDSVSSLDSGTRENLRAVSVDPSDGTALIVGNAGTALLLDEDERFTTLRFPTYKNLRAVRWHSEGSVALVAGNDGTLLKYSRQGVEAVDVGRANLRDVSWRPQSDVGFITSNCFAEEFFPSPNLYSYSMEREVVVPLNEGRADLIGIDWKPTGSTAVVVGYDVVWHNGFIAGFDGSTLSPIQFENKNSYPTAVAWNPGGELAAIVTATGQVGVAKGAVFLWDEKSLKPIYEDGEFFFSDVAWRPGNRGFAALASTETRTFSA